MTAAAALLANSEGASTNKYACNCSNLNAELPCGRARKVEGISARTYLPTYPIGCSRACNQPLTHLPYTYYCRPGAGRQPHLGVYPPVTSLHVPGYGPRVSSTGTRTVRRLCGIRRQAICSMFFSRDHRETLMHNISGRTGVF